MSDGEPAVEVRDLAVGFPVGRAVRRVVDGVWLRIEQGQAVAMVGESGCGKTMTALALVRLIPPPGRIVGGSVRLGGIDVRAADEACLERLRGGTVGMVFQEPSQALNPVRTVLFQVSEAARLHTGASRQEAAALARSLLAEVDLEDADRILASYPHQLSGGQLQRVVIASALSGSPSLLIADEPTSALDLVAELTLVDLLGALRQRRRLALLLISHDLALVARIADRITVLYAGETVEDGPAAAVLAAPLHPYAVALRDALPGRPIAGRALPSIAGAVPASGAWSGGCRFAPRCPAALPRCADARPALHEVAPGRQVRCFLHHDVVDEDD